MAAAAYLITGIPGAGKTTVARLLAGRLPRAAHIEADRLQEWIVSGGLWPDQEPHEEAMRQLEQRAIHAARLATSYHEAGFSELVVMLSGGNMPTAADPVRVADTPAIFLHISSD